MWAAILSDEEVSLQQVSKELSRRGWTLASGLVEVSEEDELPSDIFVWMLFNCSSIGRLSFSCQGYVRIGTTEEITKTLFVVVSDSLLIRTYYQGVMALYMWYYKVKGNLFSRSH